jgi:hypothetical protein
VHDSPHAIADWDWNQRDLPHIPFIHGGFRLVPGAVDDGLVSGVYVQRILGVRLPLAVSYHHLSESPRSRVYAAAMGPILVVVGADLEPIAGGTRVSTVYSLGSLPAVRLILPLAEIVLRRNYARLTKEDEPMRERRRTLRAWGYRFADAEGPSYARSLDVTRSNVVAPPGEARPERVAIGEHDREVHLGRDDHLGLRVVVDRAASRLRVYPRMCPHEGASLDGCAERGSALRCPWHGRRITPLATFDLTAPGPEVRETPHHRLSLSRCTLTVTPAPARPGG